MNNEQRLSIALEHLMREHNPEEVKAICNAVVDRLHRTLPKERGGTKVSLTSVVKGKSTPSVGRKPGRLKGSLSVRKQ